MLLKIVREVKGVKAELGCHCLSLCENALPMVDETPELTKR